MLRYPDDDSARSRFYGKLAETEVLLLLENEPSGDKINPKILSTDQRDFALIFDGDEMLAEFTKKVAPYVSLSGRAVVNMLAGQNIGMALNAGTETPFLMPADAVDWLAEILGQSAQQTLERPTHVSAPNNIAETEKRMLADRLEQMKGLADCAYLVNSHYSGGSVVGLLGFINAEPSAQNAIVQAIKETTVFFGEAGFILDVAFFRSTDKIHAKLVGQGLKFDLARQIKTPLLPAAPGSDPAKPPRLR